MGHERGRKRDPDSVIHVSPFPPTTTSPACVYDQMEREQEAIVNKLQREMTSLREERSRSRSRSSSVSSQTNRPSIGSRPNINEQDALQHYRRENEVLRKKITNLTVKLAEKDLEIERLNEQLKLKSSS